MAPMINFRCPRCDRSYASVWSFEDGERIAVCQECREKVEAAIETFKESRTFDRSPSLTMRFEWPPVEGVR